MCSLQLHVEQLDQIDKYRKHVLCIGGDVTKKGGYLVAWKHAYKIKEDGGLGIINLRNHNVALLLKFLHKFYKRLDLPWVHIVAFLNVAPSLCSPATAPEMLVDVP
jgi:hypothetical protein